MTSCHPISLKVIILRRFEPVKLCQTLLTRSQLQLTLPRKKFWPCLSVFRVMQFVDVSYRVKIDDHRGGNIKRIFCQSTPPPDSSTMAPPRERTILKGITGTASPGEILAILGPSGSGKSTLLNALAGRLRVGLSGTIIANDRRVGRSIMRRTGFVAQDDVLYPHLTVRETLVFCALLRLPWALGRLEKVAAVEAVIAELGLAKCEHTIIGNSFVRGVSGGERKRVSIAHEMLVNPSLLVLDEPTSGLDSTAAHRLMATLGSLAQKGKTVVTSVHQPSSRVYQMFDSVLVLSEGRCLYFGKGRDALSYFKSVGFAPAFPMNPADFLLDLANGTYVRKKFLLFSLLLFLFFRFRECWFPVNDWWFGLVYMCFFGCSTCLLVLKGQLVCWRKSFQFFFFIDRLFWVHE